MNIFLVSKSSNMAILSIPNENEV